MSVVQGGNEIYVGAGKKKTCDKQIVRRHFTYEMD